MKSQIWPRRDGVSKLATSLKDESEDWAATQLHTLPFTFVLSTWVSTSSSRLQKLTPSYTTKNIYVKTIAAYVVNVNNDFRQPDAKQSKVRNVKDVEPFRSARSISRVSAIHQKRLVSYISVNISAVIAAINIMLWGGISQDTTNVKRLRSLSILMLYCLQSAQSYCIRVRVM